MKSWKIIEATPEDTNFILARLGAFNKKALDITIDSPSSTTLNYIIKIDNNVIAGINSNLYFMQNILHIGQLFVDEQYRGQQLGSLLLLKAENEAKARNVKLAHLDTFDWQAKDFYLKHGYEIFGILENCPEGHNRYYLKKIL